MLERRAYNRHSVDLDATVSFGTLVLSHCRVLDASVGGLGIWLNGVRFVPLEINLTIDGNLLPLACCLAWRGGDFVGLRFVSSAVAAGPSTREEQPNAS
ncbi:MULTISPECIES: PilZ domain-containing protein [Bradyrhizobium]|uniref:PilZ domain-containing protein n=1 Tax=Bradyrhizobium TaxID=374 RepID=UPI00360FA455